MLAEGEQEKHHGIPLFPVFPLLNHMGRAFLVFQRYCECWRKATLENRRPLSWDLPTSHSLNQVENSDAIYRQYCSLWVQLWDSLQCMSDAARSGRKSVLKGSRRCFDCIAHLLRHCAADQPAHNVPNDYAANSAWWFLQRGHTPQSDHLIDALRCLRSRQLLSIANKRRVSRLLSNNGLKWSAVIPEGPAATPFLDDRRLAANLPSSKNCWIVVLYVSGNGIFDSRWTPSCVS